MSTLFSAERAPGFRHGPKCLKTYYKSLQIKLLPIDDMSKMSVIRYNVLLIHRPGPFLDDSSIQSIYSGWCAHRPADRSPVDKRVLCGSCLLHSGSGSDQLPA